MPLSPAPRSFPSLPALDSSNGINDAASLELHRLVSDDFQSNSLKVFQSKHLWNKFQTLLQEENVSNPSAVKMKLHEFILQRQEELWALDLKDESVEEEDTIARRGSAFDLLGKLWNITEPKRRNSTSSAPDDGFLTRITKNALDVNTSDVEEENKWIFNTTTDKSKDEGIGRRSSIFTSWRRETGSTSDLTNSLTTSLRRGSNATLSSLGSMASEIEERRRDEVANVSKRGSYHDDLFEGT